MEGFHINDSCLYGLTYNDIVLIAQNNHELYDDHTNRAALRKEVSRLLACKTTDCLSLIDEHFDEIIYEAFGRYEEQPYITDPDYGEEKAEELAKAIYKFLLEREMWIDISIFYNGKRMSTSTERDGKTLFAYNGEPFIEDGFDPRDYDEYASNICTVVFEGAFYEIINGYVPGWEKIEDEFNQLLEKYGVYYEMGDAFNLTCYKI